MQHLISLMQRLAAFVRRLRITFLPVLLLCLAPAALARDIYVSPTGSDTNKGTIDAPVQTLVKVGAVLAPGDHVWMRQGTYRGGLRVRQPGVTVEAYGAESVSIALPLNDPLTNTVWIFKSDVTLRHLDISGGYYAVKFETYAANGTVDHCHIHDSGADGIKIVPLTSHVTVIDCEIDHTGATLTNCQGIDAVNSDYLTVTRCHLHDIPNVAVSNKGGSQFGVVSDCRMERIWIGVQVGQITDRASMYPSPPGYPGNNPGGYESRDQTVQNCIIVDASFSGISCWAALRPRLIENVILNADTGINIQENTVYPPVGAPFVVPCKDLLIQSNMVRLTAQSVRFAIYVRYRGLVAGTLTLRSNAYAQPGKDPLFVDDNSVNGGPLYKGTFGGWAQRMNETGSLVLPQPPAGLSGPPVLPTQ